MRPFPTLLSGVALGALAACTTVGPNYHVPNSAAYLKPEAHRPFIEESSPNTSDGPTPDRWWQLYDDATLNDLVQDVLKANTDIRTAAANLERAQAIGQVVKDQSRVQGAASASIARSQLSGEEYLVPDQLPSMNLADVGAGVSYDVDLFGQLRRAEEASVDDREAAQAGLNLVRINVVAQLVGTYLDACSMSEQITLSQRSIAVQQRILTLDTQLVAAGRGTAAEITRARSAVDQASALPPLFEARRQNDFYRMAALLGRTPSEAPKSVLNCTKMPVLRQRIPVGDGSGLLSRRPDVRRAERNLAAAIARYGVAVGNLYPDIRFGASAGTTGLVADLGEASTNRWTVGSLVTWRFPNSGARGQIKAADATADAALAQFDATVLNALQETETSLSTYNQDLDRNASLLNVLGDAQTSALQTERLRAAGRATAQNSLEVERSELGAEIALAASNGQVANDQVRLFFALGGGWQGAPIPNQVPAISGPAKAAESSAEIAVIAPPAHH